MNNKRTVIAMLMARGLPERRSIPGPVPAHIGPLEVRVEGGDDFSFHDAHKKFRLLVQRERVIGQINDRRAYEKPSVKKRRKKREAVARKIMAERKDETDKKRYEE